MNEWPTYVILEAIRQTEAIFSRNPDNNLQMAGLNTGTGAAGCSAGKEDTTRTRPHT